jgi:hypothetical protein
MPEVRELQAVIEAAERAASGGDYVTAELNLREAAALQEAQLGSFHPDLANTLNNLGVVYERADSPAEAELCYRRAYAIATKALEPGHPLLTTSRKNLEDFCQSRGRPFNPSETKPERVTLRKPGRRSPSPMVVGMAGAVGFAMLVIAALWLRTSDSAESSASSQMPPSAARAATAPPRVPVATPPPSDGHASNAGSSESVVPERRRSVPRESRAAVSSAPVAVTISEAHLCQGLSTSNWRCDQISSPVKPGMLFFYTRVNASNSTTVEHRWYRDNRLSQSVELPIRPSPGNGYRTYSRRTVTAENAGNWRVEVRTKDGLILHEESFVVR